MNERRGVDAFEYAQDSKTGLDDFNGVVGDKLFSLKPIKAVLLNLSTLHRSQSKTQWHSMHHIHVLRDCQPPGGYERLTYDTKSTGRATWLASEWETGSRRRSRRNFQTQGVQPSYNRAKLSRLVASLMTNSICNHNPRSRRGIVLGGSPKPNL